jgi:anhydro-N-acetylmuramic acid kinase
MQVTSPKDPSQEFFIGLMSGTSLDGFDGVLCAIDANGRAEVLIHVCAEFSADLKASLLELQAPTENELHKEALAANQLAREYAQNVMRILKLAQLTPQDIRAIGAHGQTIRHQPVLSNSVGYSLQCLSGALLAELTNIDVINDFRSRDIAAQGQGAPLVPAFHLSQFGNSVHSKAILNLGGIANLTLLSLNQTVLGFDTGPGNMLLDSWIFDQKKLSFDDSGQWAKTGKPHIELLHILCDEAFFSAPIPKSTGRDLFNLQWLLQKITLCKSKPSPEDVQASLVELTCITIVQSLELYLPDCREVIVCGGGAKNQFLLEKLTHACKGSQLGAQVITTQELGLDPQTIEGMAFAWLAWCFDKKSPGNISEVTGAKGPRILGTLHYKSY